MARLAAAAGSVLGFWQLTREHLRQGVVFVLAVVWSQAAFFTTHIYINWRGNILSNIEMLLPLGAAFFLWDRALKLGDARHIGILSYITPLASTTLLMVVSGRALSWSVGVAALLIIGAAILGTRAR